MRLIPTLAITAFPLLSLILWAADTAQRLNIKSGLWEVTTTDAKNSDEPIPDTILGKLTPEQRARIEERMKARKADLQKAAVSTQCITEDQLERGVPFRPVHDGCNWISVSSTSDKVTMRAECVAHGTTTIGTLSMEALGPQEAKGSIQYLTTRGDAASSLTSTFVAKWLGQRCLAR
jgi:hypothetical protein